MQLIDSTRSELNTEEYRRLLSTLQDITHKVEIRSDFSILHPDYKPLQLPAEVVERFQKLPEEMQNKYLTTVDLATVYMYAYM